MAAWGQRWAYRQIGPNELDSAMLMLGAARHVPPADMPRGKMVVRFEFHGIPKEKPSPRYWWWVIERPDIDVCLKDYGFDIDLVVRADLGAFVHLFLGHLGLGEAVAANQVGFDGEEQAIICLCRLLGFEKHPSARIFTFPAIGELGPVVPRFGGSELLPPIPRVRLKEHASTVDKLS
jgi:hypothetical protein